VAKDWHPEELRLMAAMVRRNNGVITDSICVRFRATREECLQALVPNTNPPEAVPVDTTRIGDDPFEGMNELQRPFADAAAHLALFIEKMEAAGDMTTYCLEEPEVLDLISGLFNSAALPLLSVPERVATLLHKDFILIPRNPPKHEIDGRPDGT
jgi:hypothetical protein